MIRQIRGDIIRILKKPGFYILFVIYVFIFVFDFSASKTVDFEDVYDTWSITYKYILPYVIGIPVYLGVFTDELKTGAFLTSIGRGISRRDIIIAKFLECLILSFIICAAEIVVEFINLKYYFRIMPTALQTVRWLTLLLSVYIKSMGAMIFAAIFMYQTWNTSVGLVVELICLAFAQIGLETIQEKLHIPVSDISFMGQADMVCRNLAASANFLLPFIVVVVYMAIFIAACVLIFERKELEL